MKLFKVAQLVVALILFALAVIMFVSQFLHTASIAVGIIFLAPVSLMGGLVYLAWEELTDKENEV